MKVILDSLLTCPVCLHSEQLIMPTDACLWFHECSACGALLKPLKGDCCVFCSYATMPCPPIQLQNTTDEASFDSGCCGEC